MKNQYTKKIKRSRRYRDYKRSRKLRNGLTHCNKLNKLQYGGEEHITKLNTAIANRAKINKLQLTTSTQSQASYKPIGGVNLELLKNKIMQSLARKKVFPRK